MGSIRDQGRIVGPILRRLGVRPLIIAAAGLVVTGAGGRQATEAPALLADVGGAPLRVAVTANSARRAMLRNADLVTEIVNGLPESTSVLILTNDRAAFTTPGSQTSDRVRFVELPLHAPLTIWPQDPFLVLSGGDQTVLLASKTFARADDRLMAPAIASELGYRLEASKLSFEGGNIVSDRRHVLIGADTIRRNAVDLDVTDVEIALRFEAELGRRVIVVGPSPQPVAHLDMMVTPLGNGRFAVADAGLGADVAETALARDPDSVAAFETWCEDHFFGRPEIQSLRGPDGPIHPPELQGATAAMVARSRTIAPVLDGIARSLAGRGFDVERLPFLDGGPAPEDLSGKNPGRRAGYPMVTYNNVLVFDAVDGPTVNLPRYGFTALDRTAAEAWRDLGFVVRPVDGFAVSAMYGGALRCAVKVLERHPAP